jgi:hypothetical protein
MERRLQQAYPLVALAAFKRMRELDDRSEEWREQHRILIAALGLKPWQYPAVLAPDAELTGENYEGAKQRWRALEAACDEDGSV